MFNGRCMLLICTLIFLSTAIYVSPRGYPQPGHVLVLLLILPLLRPSTKILLGTPEKLLLIFWVYTTIVNLTYWFMYRDISFIVSTVYWTYGVTIFFGIRKLFLTWSFPKAPFFWSLLALLPVLYLLALFGGDRYYIDSRLIGTFSDSNQMSYWLLCMFVGSLLASTKDLKWFDAGVGLGVFAAVMILVFLAGSRSAMLGLGVLLLGLGWWLIQSKSEMRYDKSVTRGYLESKSVLGIALSLSVLILVLGLVLLLLYHFNDSVYLAVHDFIRRMTEQSLYWQLEIRGYTRLVEFPQYLLFGAGQGYDARFIAPVDGHIFEVHSSIISPLFYYGIVGFGLLYTSFYLIARDRLQGWQWLVFAAPFVYGLFTYGLRTPVFWIMLASLYTIPLKADRANP